MKRSGLIVLALAVVLIGAALLGVVTHRDPEPATADYWVEEMASGLNAPWSMAWLPGGDLLIVEKHGGLRLFHDGVLEPAPIQGVPAAFQSGQSGLLDIALDPDFKRNQRVFLTFTEGTEVANHGAVYRARYVDGALVDGRVIFRTSPDSHVFPYPIAGRMLFLPDKTFLLTSTDDHGRRHLAQQLDNHIAKILRLDRDGRPAAGNPRFDQRGALPEIYAFGVRAPLGLARDPRSGVIWEVENGPRGGDELNVLKAGANYGWPLVTYGTEYTGEVITDRRNAPGIEAPTVWWVPSIAPSSVTVYTARRFPQWRGDIFVGSLIGQHLRRIRVRDGRPVEQEVMLADLKERIRDVRTGPDGYLYLLTDHPNGRLLRLRPGAPPAGARVAQRLMGPGPNLMAGMPARLTPDAARGGRLFSQQCQSCHSLDAATGGGIGPSLAGVVGRTAGRAPGFAYSTAMRDSGLTWSAQYLDAFIAAPSDYVPGTAMMAPPVRDRQDRTDIVAHLATTSR